jgi:hypothetical protein
MNNAEIIVNQLCEWTDDDDGEYSTACGQTFYLEDETASGAGFKFCPFCGKTLIESGFYEDEDGQSED